MFLRNACIYLRVYTEPKPTIRISHTPPWESHIFQTGKAVGVRGTVVVHKKEWTQRTAGKFNNNSVLREKRFPREHNEPDWYWYGDGTYRDHIFSSLVITMKNAFVTDCMHVTRAPIHFQNLPLPTYGTRNCRRNYGTVSCAFEISQRG
jgi:hypothetical protein